MASSLGSHGDCYDMLLNVGPGHPFAQRQSYLRGNMEKRSKQ